MRLTIDFETRSACDIKKHGAWVYSEHPTTEVLCLATKSEGKPAKIFIRQDFIRPGFAEDLAHDLKLVDIIEAHNAAFEYAIWTNVCVRRYGWPELPIEKLRCSAAKAAMHSLPRSLGEACAALGLAQQKDAEGYKVMMRMCKPRRPKKNEDPRGVYWNENPTDFERLYQYCMKDVEAEEGLSNSLRDLPPLELRVWQLDQIINTRGIQADLDGCRAMIEMITEHETNLLERLYGLTYGAVKTAKQVEVLRGYLRGLGVDLPDLSAETVKNALKGDNLDDAAREILEIRRSLGRSSSAKYQAIVDRAASDGRLRGCLLYHGASTGRWSGAGIQPQNFPSRIKISADPEEMLGVVQTGGLDLFSAVYDDDIMSAAGAITRSVLIAKDGHELIAADYSAIEGRGLAWLAGEDWVLEAYRANKDMYVVAAASILGIPEAEVTKEQRQSPGKIAELACGYQGGAGAVRKFNGGEGMTDEQITETIVKPWREARPATVRFWRGIEDACMRAVQETWSIVNFRAISFKVADGFLMCRLPSGRVLRYYDPRITPVETSWGELKNQVTYMTVDSITKKWVRTNTYGGKLAENVTQAICRDLMAEAMLRVEAAGYPIVLTVHDELVAEVPEGYGSIEEFCELMCKRPEWAYGFPIKAEGWRGRRYKK